MRVKKKLCEIKIYKYTTATDRVFYRAESMGISYPSRTIKGCVNGLLKDLIEMKCLEQLKKEEKNEIIKD